MNGHLKIVCDLIVAGAAADAVDGKGLRPLWYAAHENFPQIVDILIRHGGCIITDSLSIFDAILSAPRPRDSQNQLKCLELVTMHVIKELLGMINRIQADPFEESTIKSASLLSLCVLKAISNIIKKQLSCDLLQVILDRIEPHASIIKSLRRCLQTSDSVESPLIHAATEARHEIIETLLASGLVLLDDVAKDTAKSALYICCERGAIDCTKILLCLGASISISTSTGRNALHAAVERDNIQVVELLAASCTVADMIKENSSGISPLNLADNRGRTRMLKALLSAYRNLVLNQGQDPRNQPDSYVTQLLRRYSHMFHKR